MKGLDKVQKLAFSLIMSDAKFIYTIIKIYLFEDRQKKIDSNYVSMMLPYIGIFAHGAENWGNKVKFKCAKFSQKEEIYYERLRLSHKLFEMSYSDLKDKIFEEYIKSDRYFYDTRIPMSIIIDKYYNVGVDLYNEKYCGNTILISSFYPSFLYDIDGEELRDLSIVVGKLAYYYMENNLDGYNWNKNLHSSMDDIYLNIATNRKYMVYYSIENFCYFSILCNINFVVEFIDNIMIDETPQKLKYAYLLYYYLCDLIKDINKNDDTNFQIDDSLVDFNFRNCIAHYGLGNIMEIDDIMENDLFGGLTNKIFNMNYIDVKYFIYGELKSLVKQISDKILNEEGELND